MLKATGNALNIALAIASGGEVVGSVIGAGGKGAEGITGQTFIFVGWFPAVMSDF